MNVLIIGSGGREHAIVQKVKQSPHVNKVFCAPGNAGMTGICECVSITPQNIPQLVEFAKRNSIDLTIVGPELPLTLGIVDAFQNENLRVFGPDKKASILEGSKCFTKEFCLRHNIPTAAFQCFEDSHEAREYILKKNSYPIVIKADGLAAGKGVVIAKNEHEANQAITDMLIYEKFGHAGRRIVIEDFVKGFEASFIIVTDGTSFVEFPLAQDHKAVFDGDQGPNTGGMGVYAPANLLSKELHDKVIDRIIRPTLAGMKSEDRLYCGILYAGLIIPQSGEPFLLEYNCRLGDPETEVLLPLMKSDLIDLVNSTLNGTLADFKMQQHNGSAVCVILASKGYPGEYETGNVIRGLEKIKSSNVSVFHCGTKKSDEGQFLTSGGRVLAVTALAPNLPEAIKEVYNSVTEIEWSGMHYRKDIAAKAV